MKPTFADTYYFLALLNPGDFGHRRAVDMDQVVTGGIVTTHWVLTEVADSCSDPRDRREFIDYLAILVGSPSVQIVPATAALFGRGVELFGQRLDKSWSLTDCISFLVMQDLGITDALTGDQHFRQAGFNTLL